MGVFRRGNKLWIRVHDPSEPDPKKRWKSRPTSYRVGQEALAQRRYETQQSALSAGAEFADTEVGKPTVRSYGARWLKAREERGIETVDDEEARLRHWVYPALGSVPLDELRPRQVQEFARSLRSKKSAKKKPLAPRTQRHIFRDLKALLQDAVADELLVANPAVLKRGDLPEKRDADPGFRDLAHFSHAEVAQLIASPQVAEDRRTIYALLFLSGLRSSEAYVLRWADYNTTLKPLGRLLVYKGYSRRRKEEKGTKTDRPRPVPVHPSLAVVLGRWWDSGWKRVMGRDPKPEDLIVPSRLGKVRSVSHMLKKLHQDLDRLGLRERRAHDTRRTFISLALGDGARADILEWVTHPPGEQFDQYSSIPWSALCEAVACLKVAPPPDVGPSPAGKSGHLVTSPVTDAVQQRKRPGLLAESGPSLAGCTGLEAESSIPARAGSRGDADVIPMRYARPRVVSAPAKQAQTWDDCNECNEGLPEAAGRALAGLLRGDQAAARALLWGLAKASRKARRA